MGRDNMAGAIVSEKEVVFSSEVGIVQTKVTVVRGYDVEDFVKRKAISQGRVLQFINTGKNISINSPTGPRTIPSPYLKNSIELPED
jgi:hypothetical protein